MAISDMERYKKEVDEWAVTMEEGGKLYRLAEEEAKNGCYQSDAIRRVYEYEENRSSKKILHSAREKITARTRAHLILSLLLLDDGYEDAAVDSILEAVNGTHRGRQLEISALLNGNSQ